MMERNIIYSSCSGWKKPGVRHLVLILCSITVLLLPSGCNKDYFNTQPDNIVSIDEIFANRGQTERWWAGLFTNIPDPWDQPYGMPYSLSSDEMDASNWTNPPINSGGRGSFAFEAHYERIRLATIFLENVDRNQEILALENGAQQITWYKAEARFLRAYYYWRMMKNMGPVVIMPTTSSSPEDNFQIPRSTWDDCVTFILSEMAEAKKDLPTDYYLSGTSTVDGTQVGRINQQIVAAVESQVLLFHASPLFNGNTELGDFRNLDGTQLFNQSYDASRWAQAAQAAKAAIDIAESNGKHLYKVSDADPFRAAYLSSRNLFWDGWSSEGIWLRPSAANWNWEIHASPRSTQGTAYNGLAVLQALVDDFRMVDGSSIEDSDDYQEDSYVTEGTPYYVSGTNMMYVNREPRFYAYVTFNGSVSPVTPKTGENNARVEFFNTGSSGKNGAPRDWPKTGYTARKNIHPTFSVNPGINVDRPAMIIRLAELYLNYAEALNESDPGNPDVLTYLNAVRTRGGISALGTDLSQSELREAIRLERRLELCYEGHRYFDVRRWKIPDLPGSNQGGEFEGMNMDAGTYLSDPAYHTRVVALRRALWQRRFYFMPYGQNEMDRNKQLVQFPGY
ncbi:MAG TPA: RagB/SusD family nutrient uptake outer membrane protein [Parapedobacter sp.]|uniref:RagB/SusD family nutrient uptake outer membrane protein n=1 Tax=Parapedobacter sp. TaxID=1958893 RepID=UPI002C2B48EF|nr:RagB/SusD family nutrient uptake outer membrane protein [Parapedobacter sp.]HWK57427.1 RagB/SusD family nutrient uptake outer membrane protein [Parapedobacter sp.]